MQVLNVVPGAAGGRFVRLDSGNVYHLGRQLQMCIFGTVFRGSVCAPDGAGGFAPTPSPVAIKMLVLVSMCACVRAMLVCGGGGGGVCMPARHTRACGPRSRRKCGTGARGRAWS